MKNIEFNEEEHVYTVETEDGKKYTPLSVTTIINKLMHTYEGVPEAQLKQAATRGTRVHNMLEQYVKTGKKPELGVSFLGIAMSGFEKIVKELELTPLMAEEPVTYMLNEKPLYAGKFDLLAYTKYGLTLIDYKTTETLHEEELSLQLTAYKMALEQRYKGMHIKQLLCIHLPKAGYPKAYKIATLDDGDLLGDFLEVLENETTTEEAEISIEDLPW